MGEPVQAMGPAGSVLFAHYPLGHNTGGHDSLPGKRSISGYTHAGTATWRDIVTEPLTEFR